MSKVRVFVVLFLLILATWPATAKKSSQTYTVGGLVQGMAPARDSYPAHLAGVPKTDISLQSMGDGKGAPPPPFVATTSQTGQYVITNVPEGTYVLTASRAGVGTASTQIMVSGAASYIGQDLVLAPPVGSAPPGSPLLAPTLVSGPTVQSGPVYIALASLQASLGAAAPNPNGMPTTNNPNSFGRNIPGPPAFSMGHITALMYNGGDYYGYTTGHKRPDFFEAFKEGHVVIQSATTPMSIMRMDANHVDQVQYAPNRSNPYWLALNAQGTELFVATDQQGIDVYDVNSAAQIGHIAAGGVVNDLVLSPDGNWIFAPLNAGTPGVMVINPNTNQAVRFIPTPRLSSGIGNPTSVAISPDSRRIYVSISSARAGEVVCIDTVSKQVISRCAVGSQPLGIALTSDGRLLFCANNASASVSVIDVAGMREISRVGVGISPCRIAIKPDGTKAYVTCKGSAEVAVISSTASLAKTIPVGEGPTGIAITPDGLKVFVSNTTDASLSTINTDLDVMQNTTSTQQLSRPFGIAIARR